MWSRLPISSDVHFVLEDILGEFIVDTFLCRIKLRFVLPFLPCILGRIGEQLDTLGWVVGAPFDEMIGTISIHFVPVDLE